MLCQNGCSPHGENPGCRCVRNWDSGPRISRNCESNEAGREGSLGFGHGGPGGCELEARFFSDPGEDTKKEIAEFVQLADIVKLTNEECEWLFGLDASTIIQSPCQVRKHLPSAKGVLVTGGELGAAFCFDNDGTDVTGYMPVFDVETIDTTGAGDAFTAGFVYQLLQADGIENLMKEEGGLEGAVRFASACGGLTTTKPGAIEGQPTLESVTELAATKVS